MRSICLRLRRGDDLLLSIRQLAAREGLRCAVVLSGVGCVTEARVRDASGVTVRPSASSSGSCIPAATAQDRPLSRTGPPRWRPRPR